MKLQTKFFFIIILLTCYGCQSKKPNYVITDTPTEGTIYISVDESFKPVILQQIQVYESSYPKTKIIASFKSEADCFRDLQKDSTRMIIVARALNKSEEAYYTNKLGFKPDEDILAYDAVAVIVNKKTTDTIFTLQDLEDILTGKKQTLAVMDGNNATSTVRFLQDSVLKGKPFGKNVVAGKNSKDVIATIAKTPNAIGFVGLSWVGNNQEPEQKEQLNNINLALIECKKCIEKGVFAKPSQSTITFAQYSLARPLYFILKENTVALGTAFKNFMMLERGQLIFRRAGLAPAKMDFKKRNSVIKNN